MRYMIRKSNNLHLVMPLVALFMVISCSGSQQKKEWDGIDYSKVRDRDKYENDGNYTQPTVSGCTNDDLFNCN